MRWLRLVPLLLLALAAPACIEVSGGAVEARWDLRAEKDGNRIDCATAKLSAMRFVLRALVGGDEPCSPAQGDRCLFACDREVGTTGFFIPEGDYSVMLRAVSETGQELGPADGVVTPSPVVRQVRVGQLVDLGVNLVIVRR